MTILLAKVGKNIFLKHYVTSLNITIIAKSSDVWYGMELRNLFKIMWSNWWFDAS